MTADIYYAKIHKRRISLEGDDIMYDVKQVVQFFLARSSMTPKKLQKLLYYAYAWTLALLNESDKEINFRLFSEPIQAWVHGPVVPSVYNEYKRFGWNEIPRVESFNDDIFSEDVLDILNQVWEVYGSLSGNELEEISHKERPWKEARKDVPAYASSDEEISDRVIFEFFNEQAAG